MSKLYICTKTNCKLAKDIILGKTEGYELKEGEIFTCQCGLSMKECEGKEKKTSKFPLKIIGGVAIIIALLGGGGYAYFGEKDTPVQDSTVTNTDTLKPIEPLPKPDTVEPDIPDDASGGIDLGVNTISKIEGFVNDLRDNKTISQSEVDAEMQNIINNIDNFSDDQLGKLNVQVRDLESELRMAEMNSANAVKALNTVRQKQGYTVPQSKR